MSGPIVRKYGFPNFEKIFGPKPVLHGIDGDPKAEPPQESARESSGAAPQDRPEDKPGDKDAPAG